jgi:hypothetical protein
MKACLLLLAAAALVAGCGAVPFRYDGPDAATLAGHYAIGKATSSVVEVNGQHRELPFTFEPIKVRAGLLKVGVHLYSSNGDLRTGGCFEVDAAPGGYYQFSSSVVEGGFLVYLHQGQGESRKLIGEVFIPFGRWMGVPPQYCPPETRADSAPSQRVPRRAL